MSGFLISEMDINSYIDGYLDSEKEAWIEDVIARDSALAREILELRNLKRLVRSAYRLVAPPSSRVQVTRPFVAPTAGLWLVVGIVSDWFLHFVDSRLGRGVSPIPMGVVIQVSENDAAKWQVALINAQNVRKTFGGAQVAIEIVAFGPGLKMFHFNSPVVSYLRDLAKSGVKLLACGHTMTMTHTTRAELCNLVDVVPTGIVEIMQKQRGGYAYVRP